MNADYLTINAVIGVGLALDAMIFTIVRFQMFKSPARSLQWAGAVGMTHWLFPMIGFLLVWYLGETAGVWAVACFLAFVLMAWFTVHVIREALDPNADKRRGFWLLVWAVSMDAAISGPGKAPAAASWTEVELWTSFFLVGAIVFVLVLAAAAIAATLRRRRRRLVKRALAADGGRSAHIQWRTHPAVLRLARAEEVATWLAVSIFAGFSALGLVEGLTWLDVDLPRWLPIALGLACGVIGYAVVGRAVARVAKIRAWRAFRSRRRGTEAVETAPASAASTG